MTTKEILIASCWTTAGNANPLPGQDLSPFPLKERIEAASEAGFRGFGLLDCDIAKFLEDHSLPDLKKILDDNGMEAIEIEFLTNWFETGEKRKESDALREKLLTASKVLGAHHLKVAADITGAPWDKEYWIKELTKLGDDAKSYDTKLALEFMPFANINNLATGLDLVNSVNHPNVGLMVDMWHIGRGGTSIEEVSRTPLNRIYGVELDDADAEQVGDGYSDTIHRRRYCGEGDMPVVELIQTLKIIGWQGPWGVEIISEEHRKLNPKDAAKKAFDTTVACFAQAGF